MEAAGIMVPVQEREGAAVAAAPSFAALPAAVRAEVGAAEAAMRRIDSAPGRGKKAVIEREAKAGLRGWSAPSLRRKYYAWLSSGRSWEALVDHAKAPRRHVDLHCPLAELFRTYAENNQRASKPGWRQMMRDLAAGKRFAGLGDWRAIFERENPGLTAPAEFPRGWIPRGWRYENLQRAYGPTAYELTALRIGAVAARAFAPSLRTTRAGLEPGQIYQFDDLWHDLKVLVPGYGRELVRPLEWACMDVASADKIAYFLRAQVKREDGVKDSLKRWQFKALVWHVLCEVGYHRGGAVFVVEHGSASLTDAEKQTITDATGGLVTFRGGDILGAQILKGMRNGQGHGNFKAKALLEGSHRLLHYEAAALPAQTGGSSRDDKPEQLYGIEQNAKKVIAAFERVPPELRGLLDAGALPFMTYCRLVADLYAVIFGRTDHRMEGWESNGWVKREWSVDGLGGWRAEDEIPRLPPAMQAAARKALTTDGLNRTRRMSPEEVWRAGRGKLARLPLWALVDFLGSDCAIQTKVGVDGLISFVSQEIFGTKDTMRYAGLARIPDGTGMVLPPGRKLKLYCSPLSPDAVACDRETGAVIGVVRQWASVSALTREQMDAAMEAQQRMIGAAGMALRFRHSEAASAALAVTGASDAVLATLDKQAGAGAPVPKDKKAINAAALAALTGGNI